MERQIIITYNTKSELIDVISEVNEVQTQYIILEALIMVQEKLKEAIKNGTI